LEERNGEESKKVKKEKRQGRQKDPKGGCGWVFRIGREPTGFLKEERENQSNGGERNKTRDFGVRLKPNGSPKEG